MSRRFLGAGLLLWTVFPVLAIANGALRDLVVRPLVGEAAAELIGAATLLGLVYAVTFGFLRRAGRGVGARALWALGLIWVLLTVAFEAAFFGLVVGLPTAELVAAYDVRAGQTWPFVVLGVLLAPPLVGRGVRGARR